MCKNRTWRARNFGTKSRIDSGLRPRSEKLFRNEKLAQRVSSRDGCHMDIRGSFEWTSRFKTYLLGWQKPWRNEHVGACIRDWKAQRSMTLGRSKTLPYLPWHLANVPKAKTKMLQSTKDFRTVVLGLQFGRP